MRLKTTNSVTLAIVSWLTSYLPAGAPFQSSPPPPPPPFSSRTVPTATSPPVMQSQHNSSLQQARNVLPPLQTQEALAQAASLRPASGMSISAMLGADAAPSRDIKREINRVPSRNTPVSILSPLQGSPVSAGNSMPRGGTTFEKYKSWVPENPRSSHVFSNPLPPRPFSDNGPFDHSRFGQPLMAPNSQSSPRSFGPSEAPMSNEPPSFTTRKYSHSDPHQSGAGRFSRISAGREGDTIHENRFKSYDPTSFEEEARRRASKESLDKRDGSARIPLAPTQIGEHDPAPNGTTAYNHAIPGRDARKSAPDRRTLSYDDKPNPSQAIQHPLSRLNNLPTVPDAEYHRGALEPLSTISKALQEPRRSITLSESPELRRDSPLSHLQRQLAASAAGADDSGSSPEQSRKMLSLLNDNKRGRASPLPQAVQGVQAQLKGPASEPGIKNEFARMFSGIGSGVGSAVSTPVPPDTQPPDLPSSPVGPDEVDRSTPLGRKNELINQAKTRNTSQSAVRRRRKTKEGDIKKENDEGNGSRLARGANGRGQKRTRNNYQNVTSIGQG